MIITQNKIVNAVGEKVARACESCLKKCASWFCPAADAFLCHACDSIVYAANELAVRHKRVHFGIAGGSELSPSWHQGFTKKARTPRNPKAKPSYDNNNANQMYVVPEVSNDDNEGYLVEENEENDMGFSVPTFDYNNNDCNNDDDGIVKSGDEVDDGFNISLIGFDGDEWDNMPEFLRPEKEFPAEFAVDVESLLEQEEAVKMEEDRVHYQEGKVKIEEEGESTTDHCYYDWSIDVESEMLNFDLNYNYVNNDESQISGAYYEEEEENKVIVPKQEGDDGESNSMIEGNKKRRKILLRLNYEEVINAWATLGCSSPWTTGRRPEFDLDHDGWPFCMEAVGPPGIHHHGRVEWIGVREKLCGGDGGREARISRYREKRRTRFFSKKIRYQVRKLNAEKRPRLKGRFVKRTSLASPLSSFLNQ